MEVKQSGQQTILLCIRKQISENIWSRHWTLGAYSWWWNPFCCPESTAEILIPLVPARANDRDGYTAEMQAAGFIVEEFVEMDVNEHCLYSASIFVRKPWELLGYFEECLIRSHTANLYGLGKGKKCHRLLEFLLKYYQDKIP